MIFRLQHPMMLFIPKSIQYWTIWRRFSAFVIIHSWRVVINHFQYLQMHGVQVKVCAAVWPFLNQGPSQHPRFSTTLFEFGIDTTTFWSWFEKGWADYHKFTTEHCGCQMLDTMAKEFQAAQLARVGTSEDALFLFWEGTCAERWKSVVDRYPFSCVREQYFEEHAGDVEF